MELIVKKNIACVSSDRHHLVPAERRQRHGCAHAGGVSGGNRPPCDYLAARRATRMDPRCSPSAKNDFGVRPCRRYCRQPGQLFF
jgi:hypothetical protein